MREIKKYIANDGTEFSDKIACIKHDGYFVCPKCSGRGSNVVKYNSYPSGLPDSGWVYKEATKDVECDVCDGKGYTKREKKPVTKIVGYEYEALMDNVIPKKISMAEISELTRKSRDIIEKNPGLRLGQTFINEYFRKYEYNVKCPELFYENDYNKTIALINERFWDGT